MGLPAEPSTEWAEPDPRHGDRWAHVMGPIDHTQLWEGFDDWFDDESYETPPRLTAGFSRKQRRSYWQATQQQESAARLAAYSGRHTREVRARQQALQRQQRRLQQRRQTAKARVRPGLSRAHQGRQPWRWRQWRALLCAIMLLTLVQATSGAPSGGEGLVRRLMGRQDINSATGRLPYNFGREARVNSAYGFGFTTAHKSTLVAPGDESDINAFDIHATGGPAESVHSVTGFLPEGAAVTPAESRYTVDPDTQVPMGDHPQASQAAKDAMRELCRKYKDRSFSYSINDLPGYTREEVSLQVISEQAAFTRPRWQSALQKEVTQQKCEEMLEAGIIEPAPRSKYASAVVVAAKKGPDGQWTDKRFCVDLRMINTITAPQHTYVPIAEELFHTIGDCSYFSKIDMRSGFFQLKLAENTKDLTSFWWNGSLYRFKRAPFGLKQMPAIFQGVMMRELAAAGLQDCTKCFIDDILIHSRSAEEHLRHVEAVLQMLESCGLRAHPSKSLMMSDTVEFLGFDVSAHGLTPSEAKIKAFKELRYPKNLEECLSVMGQLRYYGCFCEHFSSKAEPILRLLKKGQVFRFGPEQQAAMDALRGEICKPGKALGRFNPDRPVFLHTDFSNVGLGAVLSQTHEHGREYMVACCSRSLNKHERNYSSYKGECLAAVWGCKIYRHFLHGIHFTLVTDHEPLKWLMGSSTLEGAHARWACMLQEYDFEIVPVFFFCV